MSFEIKPEQLTDALISDYMEFRRGPDDPLIWHEHFQRLCGLLVKHGLVSPPVYCFRHKKELTLADRDDTREPLVDISSRIDLFNDQWQSEHWKGQTE